MRKTLWYVAGNNYPGGEEYINFRKLFDTREEAIEECKRLRERRFGADQYYPVKFVREKP
jgi:hypothetical protein